MEHVGDTDFVGKDEGLPQSNPVPLVQLSISCRGLEKTVWLTFLNFPQALRLSELAWTLEIPR